MAAMSEVYLELAEYVHSNYGDLGEYVTDLKKLISELSNIDEHGVEPLFTSLNQHPPLLTDALQNGNYNMAKLLLEAGANPNLEWENIKPIFWPISDLYIDGIELLIKYGAKVTQPVARWDIADLPNSNDYYIRTQQNWVNRIEGAYYLIDPIWMTVNRQRNYLRQSIGYEKEYITDDKFLSVICLLINNGADVSLVPEQILLRYKKECNLPPVRSLGWLAARAVEKNNTSTIDMPSAFHLKVGDYDKFEREANSFPI